MRIRFRPHGLARCCNVRQGYPGLSILCGYCMALKTYPVRGVVVSLLAASLFVCGGCCPRVSMVDVGPLPSAPVMSHLAVAHRGNLHRGALPDNSIPALNEASAEKVPLLEVDVRRSADGDLFLFHDGSIQRDNSYVSSDLIGRQVQSLSASERARVFLDKNKTIVIPTLRDALRVIESSQHSSLQLDLKGESDELAFAALDLVAQHKLFPKVLVQLRSSDRIRAVKQRYPQVRISARCLSPEQLEAALSQGVEMVELERWVSADAIRRAHTHGVYVLLNIASSRLDEPSTWNYLRTRGIDAIMSDYADRHRTAVSPVAYLSRGQTDNFIRH